MSQPARHPGFTIRRLDQDPERPGSPGDLHGPTGRDDQARRLGHSTVVDVDLTTDRQFPFAVTRQETQGDPTTMSGYEIREFARNGGLPLIVATVKEILTVIPKHPTMPWPEPLYQRGVSCQTVAIVNGIRCYQAIDGQPWNPSHADIDALRERAGHYEGEATAFDAKSVALVLRHEGRLGPDAIVSNPIDAAARIAYEGFAVMTDGGGWHATTVVPNFGLRQFGPGKVPAFISIDSLSGSETPMGAKKFCRAILAQDWEAGDQTLICSMPPRPGQRPPEF